MDKRNLIIMVKCEIGRTYDVAAEIADLPEGPIVYSTSGDYDLFTMFRLGNNDDIGHYVCETIQKISGPENSATKRSTVTCSVLVKASATPRQNTTRTAMIISARPIVPRVSVSVDTLTQLLAGFEMRDRLGRNHHGIAGFRVTPDPLRAEMQGETAESTDLDAVFFRKRIGDLVQHQFDSKLHILVRQMWLVIRQLID